MIPANPTPDYSKEPTRISIKHSDMPELSNSKIGDHVHMHVHGKVVGVHAPTEYGDGTTELHVHKMASMEPDEDGIMNGEGEPPTEHEVKTMPLDKLRKKLPHKDD